MAGTLPTPPPLHTDPIAELGLLGTHTMLSHRARRDAFPPAGPATGPIQYRSEQFGFSAWLPRGWMRRSGEAIVLERYGLIQFEDIEVLTPAGAHARIGASVEPVCAKSGALARLTDMYVESTGGQVFARARRLDSVPSVDLTVALASGDLLICRLYVEADRVLTVETLHAADSDAADGVMNRVHRGFEVLETMLCGITSGTYRIR